MSISRKFITAVGVAVATSVALAGCGAGSRTGANTATKVACDFTNPEKATTVNVLAYNSSAVDPYTNTMVASCTHDNVTVKHDPIDFAGQVQKTQATLGSKTGSYDVIETYGFVIHGFAADGKLQPLDELYEKYKDQYGLGEINAEMRERMSYEGKLYALPMQAQTLTLAYRKDIFDELGLKPPTTFAELREVSQKIQDSGKMEHPLAMPWLASSDITTAYGAALGSQGVPYVDPETKTPNFTSEESKKSLEEMKSLMPYMDPQVTTFDQPKVQQQMYNGSAAMSIMYSGRLNDLTVESNTKFAKDFAFAPPPAVFAGGKQYGSLSIDGWSIPTNASADPDLLFQLIASSVSEDASRASMPAAYPARDGMAEQGNLPYGAAVTDAIDKAPAAQPYPWVPAITNDTMPVLAQVVTGGIEVEDGMQQMQQLAEKALETE